MTEKEFAKKYKIIFDKYMENYTIDFISYLEYNDKQLNNAIEMYNEYSDRIDYSCELIIPNDVDRLCHLYDSLEDFIISMYEYNHYFNKNDEYIYIHGDGYISTKSKSDIIEIILSKMHDMFNI